MGSRPDHQDEIPHPYRPHYPGWKPQQKVLWAEVKKETGRWRDRWNIRDLLADGRCGRVVLDFLSTTDVGRRVPAEEEDAVSEVSEAELQEWMEEQVAGPRSRTPREYHPRFSYPCPSSWRPRERHRGRTGPRSFPLTIAFAVHARCCNVQRGAFNV